MSEKIGRQTTMQDIVAEPISTSTPQMSNMVKRVNKNSQKTMKETKAR